MSYWKRTQIRRGTAAILSFVFLLESVLAPAGLRAQPVQAPQANLPTFQSPELQPFFDAANTLESQGGWEWIVAQGRMALRANWELAADVEIANLVNNASVPTDYFHDQQAYRDFLLESLEIQKQQAKNNWENAVEVQIAIQRSQFLTALIQEHYGEQTQNASQNLAAASSVIQPQNQLSPEAQKEFDAKVKQYEQQFKADIERALSEYNAALEQAENDYAAKEADLDQAELNFQAGLAQIDAYENTVRAGIASAVAGLENYLQNSPQFYNENCTAQNSCSYDMANLRAAGQELAQLLADLQQALNNDTPLTTLATMMANYLSVQRDASAANMTHWQDEIYTDGALPQSSYFVGDMAHLNALRSNADNPIYFFEQAWYGNTAPLENYLRQGDYRTVQNLANVNVCADNNLNYAPYPLTIGATNQEGCFISHGVHATLTYDATGLGAIFGIPVIASDTFAEQNISFFGTFQLYDANAESNYTLWQGYNVAIDGMQLHWANNLVTAANTWETQKADYEAAYAAYLAEAAQLRADNLAEYQTEIAGIQADKQRYLARVEEDRRAARNDLILLRRELADLQSQNATQEQITAAIQKQAVTGVSATTNLPTQNTGGTAADRGRALLESSKREAPEAAIAAEEFAEQFRVSVRGALNLGVQKELNAQALDFAEDATESFARALRESSPDVEDKEVRISLAAGYLEDLGMTLKEDAETAAYWQELARALGESVGAEPSADEQTRLLQLAATRLGGDFTERFDQTKQAMQESRERLRWRDVEVLPDGRIRAKRQVATGEVRLRAGGDATKQADYEIVTVEEEIWFNGVGSVKLADAGKLFSHDFDLEKANVEFAKAQETLAGIIEKQYEEFGKLQVARNDNNNRAQNAAQQNIQNQVQINQAIAGLIQTLVTGGSAIEYLESYAKSLVEAAFEEMTGIPGGFLTGWMSGMKPHRALMKAVEDRAMSNLMSEIDKVVGIPGAGAYLQDLHGRAMERKKKHEAFRGKNLLQPFGAVSAVLNHTQFGKSVKNMDVGLMGGMMMGMPMAGLALSGAMKSAGDKPRKWMAKTMEKGADWLDKNGNDLVQAGGGVAALAMMGLVPGMGPMALNVMAVGAASDGIADALRGGARVVASAGGTIAEIEEAYHDEDLMLNDAVKLGSQRIDDRWARYEKGNLGTLLDDAMFPLKLVGAAMSKPQVQITDAERTFKTNLAGVWSSMSGWPTEFTRAMFVDRASMGEAAMAQFYSNLDSQFFPGASDMFKTHMAARDLRQQRREAARFKPEDLHTFGLTYAWRNAELHKDGQVALTVVETGVSAAAVALTFGAATPAVIAYQAAKQAYKGSREGGIVGASAGLASGAISGLASMSGVPVNVGLTYSYDDGWGASIGVSVPAGGGVNAGLSLNFQEGQGYTGGGVNLGYSGLSEGNTSGFGAGLGVSFDAQGNFAGANLNATHTWGGMDWANSAFDKQALTGSLGLRLGPDGKYAGFDVDASYAMGNGTNPSDPSNPFNWLNETFGSNFDNEFGQVDYTVGAGLGWNRDNSFNVRIRNDLAMSDRTGAGLVGVGAQWTDTFAWNADGGFEGVQNSIQLTSEWRTREQSKKAYTDLLNELVREGDVEGVEALEKMRNSIFGDEVKKQYFLDNRDLLTDALGRELSDEEIQQILDGKHPDIKLSEALELIGIERTSLGMDLAPPSDSRTTLWEQISGAFDDAYDWAFTDTYSDADGFVDPETGEWRQRTCFVAGTLVVTQQGYKPIEEIQAGDSVLSWNEETGEREYKRVAQTFQRTTDRIYIVNYADGTTLETTWNHEFYIEGKGWMDARNLEPGDRSPTADGRVLTIASMSIDARYDTVYNFEVEGNHTYYVGEKGVLVHNEALPYGPALGGLQMRGETLRFHIAQKYGLSGVELRSIADEAAAAGNAAQTIQMRRRLGLLTPAEAEQQLAALVNDRHPAVRDAVLSGQDTGDLWIYAGGVSAAAPLALACGLGGCAAVGAIATTASLRATVAFVVRYPKIAALLGMGTSLGYREFASRRGDAAIGAETVVLTGKTLSFQNFSIFSRRGGAGLLEPAREMLQYAQQNGATTLRFQGTIVNERLAERLGTRVFDVTIPATQEAIVEALKVLPRLSQ